MPVHSSFADSMSYSASDINLTRLDMRRKHFLALAGAAAVGAGRPTRLTAREASPVVGAANGPGTNLTQATLRDPPRAQEDPRFEELSRLVEAKMAEYRVPGVGFGVLHDDLTIARGFGITNLDNPQPVTPDTVFPIASISKTVATTAIMRLVERGRIDLDAPVRAYIPDFGVADEDATREVRVGHLLTHTPGWEGQLGTPDRGTETGASFVAGLRDLPQLARPGEVWSYNNAGFGVAGRILEVVTDGSIHEALSDLVFEPLDLTRAFTRTGQAMTYRFAAPHRDADDGSTEVIHSFQLPVNSAVGGAAMSIADMLRYARFHLGDGTARNGQRILTRASLEAMRTPRVVKNSTTDEMGVGWHLRRLNGVLTAAHGGTLSGHCLHVQLVPERGLAFGILTNHNQGWRLIQDVERATLEAYEGLSLAPGQATGGNRGGNENMTVHASPLASPPAHDEYVGHYVRPPLGELDVRSEGGNLVVSGYGAGDEGITLAFWGPDLTYSAPPRAYAGMPVEFIREEGGAVRWIRINGRIARKS